MFDFIEDLIFRAAGAWWMHWAVFALCAIDGFFPVVPSESVLVGLASISDRSESVLMLPLFFVGWGGAVVGDQIAYLLGRTIGVDRFRWMRTRSVRRAIGGARAALKHSGATVIITARHIPGGRVATNFVAGATRFSWRKFFVLDLISSAVWAAFSLVIGRFTAGWIDNTVLQIALALVVAGLLGLIIDRVIKKFMVKKLSETEQDPDPVG